MSTSMAKVTAPFTEEQVKSLNGYQQCEKLHPFTCPQGHSLIAVAAGWACPACLGVGTAFRQTWAWRFMADFSWKERLWQPKV